MVSGIPCHITPPVHLSSIGGIFFRELTQQQPDPWEMGQEQIGRPGSGLSCSRRLSLGTAAAVAF
jgi:hypothetical protein